MVFWKELNKYFWFFFPKGLFFWTLGILSTPLFWWLKWTTHCTISNSYLLLTTISPPKRYLKSVYRQSTCWLLNQNAFIFCNNSLMSPIRIMCFPQLGRKHILSSWPAIQYSLLTIFFSYVPAEIKRLLLNNLYKSWESLEIVQLPSDCCVVFWTNESEKQGTFIFCTNQPKKKRGSIYGNVTWQGSKKEKIPYMEMSRDNDQNNAYVNNEMQLQNHSLTTIHKNKPHFSATSTLSCSPMAYNKTASLDKLTCTNYVDFGKCEDRFRDFFWSKNDSNYLDVKLKVSKKDANKEFRLVQNLTMGETDFNLFMRLRIQQVNAAENFAWEENLNPVLIPTMSKGMVEQLKRSQGCWQSEPNKEKDLCDTAAVQCGIAWKFICSSPNFCKLEGGREVSTSCLMNFKLEEFVGLLDLMNSVYDKFVTNQHIFNVLKK